MTDIMTGAVVIDALFEAVVPRSPRSGHTCEEFIVAAARIAVLSARELTAFVFLRLATTELEVASVKARCWHAALALERVVGCCYRSAAVVIWLLLCSVGMTVASSCRCYCSFALPCSCAWLLFVFT